MAEEPTQAAPAQPAAPASTTPPATPAAPPAQPDKGTEPDWKAEAEKAKADVEKWKSMSRKHEEQAKANAGTAAQAKTLEERLAELEKTNADAEARATRAEVASEKGLPAKLARFLQGTTREELEASADELLAELKPKAADTASKGKPKEALRPGAVPNAEATPNYDEIAARIAKAPAFGRR
ncbi:MAG: DUF4355 domain-containing protein [Salinibacterium sp.]|nr:MAG: DUF4355 domain-containing protein [Salinibacterium sp.]